MAPRTRAFTLEAVKAAPVAGEQGPRTYTFRASDGEFDRDNDRVNPKGWDLAAYNKNGVVLVNHDASELSIGKGRAYVEGNELMVDVQFDQNDPDAQLIESKVASGVMSAVSARFIMKETAPNARGGLDIAKQELIEISIVTIPANQRAVRVKSINPDAVDRDLSKGAPEMTPEEIKKMQDELAAAKAKAAKLEQDAAAAAKLAEDAKLAEAAKAAKATDHEAIASAVAHKLMDSAKGNRDGLAAVVDGPAVTNVRTVIKGSGLEFARFVKAQMIAKMNGGNTRDVLQRQGYTDQAKALSQDSFAGMGSLVHEQWATDFIEYLRNSTCIRKAGPRTLQASGGAIRFGGQASTATASYSGETTNISTSNPTTSEPMVLSEKKLVALCPIPNDLIRNASIGAEQFVRDDLAATMGVTEDSKFIYGSGASYEPRGLSTRVKSTHKYAMTALSVAKIPTIGELKKEFNKALRIMKQDNAPMRKPTWFLNPVNEAGIRNATGPGGEGYNVFEREMNEKGTLCGYPYFVSNQVTDTGTSADLFLFDMDEVVLAEFMSLEVETFPNGTYYNGSVAVSGISTDTSVVRAIEKHDIGLRHDVSGIWITGCTWGEP